MSLRTFVENQAINLHTMQPLKGFLAQYADATISQFLVLVPTSRVASHFEYMFILGDDAGNIGRRAQAQAQAPPLELWWPSKEKGDDVEEHVSSWYWLSYEPGAVPVWETYPPNFQDTLPPAHPLAFDMFRVFDVEEYKVSSLVDFINKYGLNNNAAVHFYMKYINHPEIEDALADLGELRRRQLYDTVCTIYGEEYAIPLFVKMPADTHVAVMKFFKGNATGAITFLDKVRLYNKDLAFEVYRMLDDETLFGVLEIMIAAYKNAMQALNSETE
jgi:hypothetical protein